MTVGAIYFCRMVVEDRNGEPCYQDGCGTIGYKISGRPYLHCPNLFRPLDDGDTSMVGLDLEIENVG